MRPYGIGFGSPCRGGYHPPVSFFWITELFCCKYIFNAALYQGGVFISYGKLIHLTGIWFIEENSAMYKGFFLSPKIIISLLL